jgi:hypothetical protein
MGCRADDGVRFYSWCSIMKVTDQDTGKPFNLDITPELHSDLDTFYAF